MKDYNKLIEMELAIAEIRLIDEVLNIAKKQRLYNVCGQFVRWETEKEAYSRFGKEIDVLRNEKAKLFSEVSGS